MIQGKHHRLDIQEDNIALLMLDMAQKSANVLSTEFIEELTTTFQQLHDIRATKVKGLLIASAKPKMFIAGADIDEIFAISDSAEASEKARMGQEMMAALEGLPFPSVAVIDGPCLGGGLELALACTYRIAGQGSHVKLGLPEVRLGIIPGFGGTQRLPKVIGLVPALDLILTGKILETRRAFKLGLIDDFADSKILIEVGKKWIHQKRKIKRPSRISLPKKILGDFPIARRLVFQKVKKKVIAQTQRSYPAPLVALEVLQQTYGSKSPFCYELEARKVGQLATTPVCKSLIQLFLATEEIRKVKRPDEQRRPIQKVGVLGAGVMGGGIAQLLVSKEKTVRLRDISTTAIAKGLKTVRDLNKKLLKRRRINQREAGRRLARIVPTTDWTGFRRVDFVIEAVVEKLKIKKNVFQEVAQCVSSETVLATNTSALSITEIASAVPHPERVIGLHFFNPVHKMPLVEIIQGKETSEETIATTIDLAISMGKTPIVVKDSPGFLVNRILGAYLNEACRILQEGTPIDDIEKAMKKFGMPMGPFELIDEVGLDIAEEVGVYLCSSFSHFPKPASILSSLRKEGRLGKKEGRGFYVHEKGKKKLDEKYLKTSAEDIGSNLSSKQRYHEMVDRLVLLMVNEASRCLEEKIVLSVRDVDVGMVLGTGFAPFRGGLLSYANTQGLRLIADKLNGLVQKHGDHFQPSKYLSELAQAEAQFA